MENKHSYFKLRLGVFVLAGLAILIAGIFYIGRQRHLFSPVFRINATFHNISGLEIGANVRFSGINVGTVENILIINDSTVMVFMIVDKKTQQYIKQDSYVTIGSEGIIGDKVANITHGSSNVQPASDGQYLFSVEPVETDKIIENLKKTGENATVISDQLAEILYGINHGNGTVARLIRDSSIAENINTMIVNLKNSSKGLDENMEAAKHNIFLRKYFRDRDKKRDEKRIQKNEEKKKKTGEKKGWWNRVIRKKDTHQAN